MLTIRERLIGALIALGCTIVLGGQGKRYTKLTRHDGREGYFFVGRNGALRVGATASASRSLEGTKFRARLLSGEAVTDVLFGS